MLEDHALIGFVAAGDLDRAREFYGTVLGLRLIEQSDFACVFDAHGTMLRVTAVADVATPGYTVLGWRVADIASTVTQLTSAGIRFNRYDGMEQDALGIWTTPGGDLVAWFNDPDGNNLSLTQFA